MADVYYEVVIQGSFDLIKGFVIGFLEGRGIEGEAIFEREHHVGRESTLGQLMRLVQKKGNEAHIIVNAGVHKLLCEASKRRQDELHLKVMSVREISEAHFDFRYKAYAKKFGEELKALFAQLPEGLSMAEGYSPTEKIIPEGKGIEAYAPLHDYEISAKGKIYGPIKPVVNFYGKIEHNGLIELGKIQLELFDRRTSHKERRAT